LAIIITLPLFSNTLLKNLNRKLPGKSFISLGLVQQISNNYRNSQALNLNYSFIHRSKFGIELGYTQSIDEAKHRKLNKTKDFSSLSILPTYLLVLDNNIAIKGKIGYAKNKHAEDGLSYGTELIFQINKSMGLSVAYQQMNREMKYLIINTVYRIKH
jgi:hypothetical protein